MGRPDVARLIGGPDVWQVVRAVMSVRETEPSLSADEVLELVAETSGVSVPLVRAAIAYWADFPDEIDAWIDRGIDDERQAREHWERERGLLAT
jgi:hypothetical protein